MICEWNLLGCEAHRIIPKSKNGKNTVSNGIVLCPCCHKLADFNKISIEQLLQINTKNVSFLMEEPKRL